MCDKIILENGEHQCLPPFATKIKQKCVIELLIIMLICKNLSPIVIRLKKYAIQLSILIILQYNSFLNAIQLRKCVKAADNCPYVFDSVPDHFKTQEICDQAVSKDPFMIQYCLDKYKTQEICDRAVNSFLPALKFAPDWFTTLVR